MKGKLLFVTGLAVGYVLGARAGRKRYEQIAGAANKVWQSPGVQKQVHAAQDFAAEKVGDIPGAVFDGARKAATGAINVVQAKVQSKGSKGSSGTAPGSGPKGSTPAAPTTPPETPPAFDEVQPKPDSEL